MSSVQTRSKPNCFNALHQLNRRLKHGEAPEQVLKSMEGKTGLIAFGFSAGEGAAVINLVNHIPVECKEIYEAGAALHGMNKGPITHAGLGHQCMRVGFAPELIGDEWSERMRNTPTSLIPCAERIVGDFEALPAGLRKPSGAPEVQRMTRITRAWELAITKFGSMVPQKLVADELPGLAELFRKRVFDDWLYSQTEECPTDVNLGAVPEFQKILCKHQSSIDKAGGVPNLSSLSIILTEKGHTPVHTYIYIIFTCHILIYV